MKIDISLNTASLQKKLGEMQRKMPADVDRALLRTALYGNSIIKRRTQKGQGIAGAFKPYSPDYAMFRQEKGRQTSPVNLEFTGKMLSAMQAFKGRGFAEISFTRAAEAKKAFFNNQRRPFFGFNQNEKRKLVDFFKRELFR